MGWETLVRGDLVPDEINVLVALITNLASLVTATYYAWLFWDLQRHDSRALMRWSILAMAVVKLGIWQWSLGGVLQNVWFDTGQPLLSLPARLTIMIGLMIHAGLILRMLWSVNRSGTMRTPAAIPFQEGAGPRVLIIDDNEPLGRVYRHALEAVGFSVEVVGTGEAALAYVEHYRPAVLIVDYVLPDITGDDLMRMVRRTGSDVPAIAISGDVMADGDLYARAMIKPIRPAELVLAVREVLGTDG